MGSWTRVGKVTWPGVCKGKDVQRRLLLVQSVVYYLQHLFLGLLRPLEADQLATAAPHQEVASTSHPQTRHTPAIIIIIIIIIISIIIITIIIIT